MKKKFIALFSLALCASIFYFYDEITSFLENVQIYAEGGHKEIFEISLSGEEIMNLKRSELIKDTTHTYLKPSLKLSPHILIETKFVDDRERPKEGFLLWSEVDGEIVLDTETWQTTHGFRDALQSNANEEDFSLIYALARRNGSASKEHLRRDLKLEKDPFDRILNNAYKKNLIVLFNNTVKLHMHDPHILTLPISRIKHAFVTREVEFSSLVPKNFSFGKIQKIAKASFGNDFTIRSTKEVFLPIWKIEVKTPDGSLSTSYWNAVNGARVLY